jgi:hypothetical protein
MRAYDAADAARQALPLRNPTDVTSAPPSVTWSSDERHETARNRL